MILPTKFLDEPSDIVERRKPERKSLGGAGKMAAEGKSLKLLSLFYIKMSSGNFKIKPLANLRIIL